MANAYSILHNYNQVPLYSRDYGLVQNVLSYKQGTLDQNRLRLQNTVDEIGMLDVARGVDKEYRDQRLSAVMDIANQYASGDLSQTGLTNSILSNIGQAIDSNIKTAISSTRILRSEQAEWEKKRLDNKGDYSDINRAYASRGANAYLNNQEIGVSYNGGGGFKEYINVEKNITDTLPKLAESMNWKYEVLEDGTSVFREKNTYETVPREKVDQALEGMLDQKSREQLRINAWYEGQGVDDQTLSETYNRWIDLKKDNVSDQISKYEKLKIGKSSEDQALYDEQIERAKNSLATLDNTTFERVGRESALNSMYYESFKDKYLDAYAYGPRKVATSVSDYDVALRNYENKQAELSLSERRLNLQEKNYELNLLKAGMKLDANGNPLQNSQGSPYMGEDYIVGESEGYTEKPSLVQEALKNEAQSMQSMKRLFSGYGLNESQIQEMLPQFANKPVSGKWTVQVGGRNITMDLDNPLTAKTINNFEVNWVNDNPEKQSLYTNVNQVVENVSQTLRDGSRARDWNVNSLPKMDHKLVDDGNGGFKLVPLANQNVNYYAGLVSKKNLTNAEKATLNYYVYQHMSQDKNISEEDKRALNSTFQKTVLSKISSGKENVRKDASSIINQSPRIGGAGLEYFRPDFYLTELTAGDFEYEGRFAQRRVPGGKEEFIPTGINQIITNGFRIAKEIPETQLANIQKDPSINTSVYTIDNSPAQYKAIAAQLGIVNNKIPFRVIPEIVNGNPTGGVIVQYTDPKVKEAEEALKSVKLSYSVAKDIGVSPNQTLRTPYEANYGNSAPSIKMGGISVKNLSSEKIYQLRQLNGGNVLPLESTRTIEQYNNYPQIKQFAIQTINEAKQGVYSFEYKSDGSNYNHVLFKNGQPVYSQPTSLTRMTEDQVFELQQIAPLENQKLLQAYIASEAQDMVTIVPNY